MKVSLRTILIVTIATLMAAEPSGAAPRHRSAAPGGAGSFDGLWSVAISPSYGNCGSYRAAVRIAGGRVEPAGGDFTAYGAVNRSGAISVTVSSGAGSASGSGRLSGARGSGRWRTQAGECAGSWFASRR
jgi:hypothetical protein